MNEHEFPEKTAQENTEDKSDIKQDVIVEPPVEEPKKKNLMRLVLVPATCLLLVVAIAVSALNIPGFPYIFKKPVSSVPSEPAQSDLSNSPQTSKEFEKDENGYYMIPEENIRKIDYDGPLIRDVLAGDTGKAKFGEISFTINDWDCIAETVTLGDRIYASGIKTSFDDEYRTFRQAEGTNVVFFTMTDISYENADGDFLYCKSLYSLNLRTKEVKKLSQDKTGEYDVNKLVKIHTYRDTIYDDLWVENILPNDSGNIIAFSSLRRTISEYYENVRKNKPTTIPDSDIWICEPGKDDYLLVEGYLNPQFWHGDELIYTDEVGIYWSINIKTKEKKKLFDEKGFWVERKINENVWQGQFSSEDGKESFAFIYDFRTGTYEKWDYGVSGLEAIDFNSQFIDPKTRIFLPDVSAGASVYSSRSGNETYNFFIGIVNSDFEKTIYSLPGFISQRQNLKIVAFLERNKVILASNYNYNTFEGEYYMVDLGQKVEPNVKN